VSFNTTLYREMLGGLSDRRFLAAVYEFIKTTKEIYPGTNPVAILREMTFNLIGGPDDRKRIEGSK